MSPPPHPGARPHHMCTTGGPANGSEILGLLSVIIIIMAASLRTITTALALGAALGGDTVKGGLEVTDEYGNPTLFLCASTPASDARIHVRAKRV